MRKGKILGISPDRITFDDGEIRADRDRVYVDCTAAGVRPTTTRRVFESDKITVQYVTIGIVPWSAATIGAVEASRDDDVDKNRLCPPLTFSGDISDVLELSHAGMTGLMERAADPDVAAWTGRCRLDPARAALEHMDDPQVADAFASLGANLGPAIQNLSRRVSELRTPEPAARIPLG